MKKSPRYDVSERWVVLLLSVVTVTRTFVRVSEDDVENGFRDADPDDDHDTDRDDHVGERDAGVGERRTEERGDACADVGDDVEPLPVMGHVSVFGRGAFEYPQLLPVDEERDGCEGYRPSADKVRLVVKPRECLVQYEPRDDEDEDGTDETAHFSEVCFVFGESGSMRDEGGEDILGSVEERVERIGEKREAAGPDASGEFYTEKREGEEREPLVPVAFLLAGADAGREVGAGIDMSVGHGGTPFRREVVKKTIRRSMRGNGLPVKPVAKTAFLPYSGFFGTVMKFRIGMTFCHSRENGNPG
jgi:hypothetical protein